MKVLMVCQEYYPKGSGIANLVYNIRKSMVKEGHKVDVLSPIGPDYRIDNSQKFIEKVGGIGIAYFWLKAGKLLKKIEHKYDVIYLHNPLLFTRIDSEKIRCVVHTLYYHSFKEYACGDVLRWPYNIAMILIEHLGYFKLKKFKFIVTSPKTITELEHYGIKEKEGKGMKRKRMKRKIPVIYNGHDFDAKKIDMLPKGLNYLKDKSKIKLVFVGRLVHQKNLFSLLKAFKKLEKINKKYDLTLIGGGGDLEGKLKKFIVNNKIENARILDKINHEQLLGLYPHFDYFISSSYYEGFPLVLGEALANGLVPILSPIEIYKHVRNKIKTGVIIEFNQNPKRVAEDIDVYCKKCNLKEESSKISKLSKTLFNWDRIAKEYINS